MKHPSLFDEIYGRGRITGMLHILQQDISQAYSTFIAKGPTVKIWLVPGENVVRCPIIFETPAFALDMMTTVVFGK